MYGISEKSFNQILETFKQYKSVKEVILFGSRAIGNYKKGSDIDLAVKISEETNDLSRILSILNQELPIPYDVDFVEYTQFLDPKLKAHIDEYGKVIYKV